MKVEPAARMPVGVVVERRAVDHPWQDYAWHAVSVLPAPPPMEPWKLLRQTEQSAQFHARTLDLSLYRRETEGYKVNLSNAQPVVYVVLRAGQEAEEMDVEPFLVTVCPYEAGGYAESGDEIVDGVPMPREVAAWVQAFVDEHHVDVPFRKRKRGPKNPHEEGGERPIPPVARKESS